MVTAAIIAFPGADNREKEEAADLPAERTGETACWHILRADSAVRTLVQRHALVLAVLSPSEDASS
jgi:hypothetical protein